MSTRETAKKAYDVGRDLATWPNVMTFLRGRLAARVAVDFYEDPYGTWPYAALLLGTDKADGLLAKQPYKWLRRLGFRQSEFGKRFDPMVDKYAASLILTAGLANGALPRALGGAVLAQKSYTAAHALHARSQGVELEVSQYGRVSEVATGVGLGLFVPAHNIEDPKLRHATEIVGYGLTLAGLACAGLAHLDYRRQTQEQLQQSTQA